jgi:DNA-binding transcriptional LysR family regulator
MATVLPGILREFHRRRPGIRLELSESPTARQMEALLMGEIACGFFHPEGPTPGLETRLLVQERNGVLLPADHPLAAVAGGADPGTGDDESGTGRGQRPRLQAYALLRLRDLADTPFVLFPRALNPGYYDRTLAAFAQAGIAPKIAEEVWPRSNGIGLVQAGMGAMVIAPSEARHLPAEVVWRELAGPAPESRLVAGWNASAVEPPLQAFIGVVDERFASIRRLRGHSRRPGGGSAG